MQTLRLERVRELLKRAISEVLRREVPMSDCGLISVNDVKVAKDLQSALVFVGVVGSEPQKKKAGAFLGKEAKRLQTLVGAVVELRYTPRLKFIADDSIERGNRVIAILDELETKPPEP
ncbi:MAG: 30S ribosome-binding factor RbfA [Verrucomicrobia bacterium]|nr:30S ribosome-binding factor RbfA [Verrucomicrobiota bacterium]